VPLCPPQIPHGLTREWTRASAVGGRRLTAWAMARPSRRFGVMKVIKERLHRLRFLYSAVNNGLPNKPISSHESKREARPSLVCWDPIVALLVILTKPSFFQSYFATLYVYKCRMCVIKV
jgi:hypothetical protein